MGAIFDKLFLVEPANKVSYQEILDARIKYNNPQLGIKDIFDDNALNLIYEASNGIQKHFIRMAGNALDYAVTMGDKKITKEHCMHVLETAKDSVSLSLSDTAIIIMKYLSKQGGCPARIRT